MKLQLDKISKKKKEVQAKLTNSVGGAQKTGIDFFSGLDDELENQLEGSINLNNWNF